MRIKTKQELTYQNIYKVLFEYFLLNHTEDKSSRLANQLAVKNTWLFMSSNINLINFEDLTFSSSPFNGDVIISYLNFYDTPINVIQVEENINYTIKVMGYKNIRNCSILEVSEILLKLQLKVPFEKELT